MFLIESGIFILDNFKRSMSKLLTCETFPTIKQVLVKLRLCQHTDKRVKILIFSSKTDKRKTFTSMNIETNDER